MIYIGLKFMCCILLISLLPTGNGLPVQSLRQKLERLLRDPEYNDLYNEIQQRPQHLHGMLLKSLGEYDLFDTSSEEKLFSRLDKLEKKSKAFAKSTATSMFSTSTTTASAPTKLESKKKDYSATGGFEKLSSIISKFIDLWTKSLRTDNSV